MTVKIFSLIPKFYIVTKIVTILSSKTVFHFTIKINVSAAPNKHIIMISEGSCATEDWSNDAENSALPFRNILKTVTLNCNNI